MASDPDETVRDLRFELHELLLDLKELKFDGGADELARFLETTRDDEAHAQIQKLQRQKARVSDLKARLMARLNTSSFAPSLKGSAPSPGDLPSHGSLPARHLWAPQQSSEFPYKACISLTTKTYLKAARMATFLYDNLRLTGNLALHCLPSDWLESLPLPSDFDIGTIRKYQHNGYLVPRNLIDAARAGNQNLIVIGSGRLAYYT